MANFAQTMRIIWIDGALETDDGLARSALSEAFGISMQQATNDISAYRTAHPDKVEYDVSTRRYFRRGDDAAFDPETRTAVLAAQRAVGAV